MVKAKKILFYYLGKTMCVHSHADRAPVFLCTLFGELMCPTQVASQVAILFPMLPSFTLIRTLFISQALRSIHVLYALALNKNT